MLRSKVVLDCTRGLTGALIGIFLVVMILPRFNWAEEYSYMFLERFFPRYFSSMFISSQFSNSGVIPDPWRYLPLFR